MKAKQSQIEQVAANPLRWLTYAEMTELTGLGSDALERCASLGAPRLSKRFNPEMLHKWIWENREKLAQK